jgi:hypothetical protein
VAEREAWQDDPVEVERAREYLRTQQARERAQAARLRALAGSRAARARLAEQFAPLTRTDTRHDPSGRW